MLFVLSTFAKLQLSYFNEQVQRKWSWLTSACPSLNKLYRRLKTWNMRKYRGETSQIQTLFVHLSTTTPPDLWSSYWCTRLIKCMGIKFEPIYILWKWCNWNRYQAKIQTFTHGGNCHFILSVRKLNKYQLSTFSLYSFQCHNILSKYKFNLFYIWTIMCLLVYKYYLILSVKYIIRNIQDNSKVKFLLYDETMAL